EALDSCERALALRPDFADAHNNRGNALRNLHRFDEALGSYEQALRCQPEFREALKNHGAMLFVLGRFAHAAQSYANLLRLAPDEDYAPGSLFSCRLRCCDWSDYAEQKERLSRMVRDGKKAATPFALLNASDSPADQQRCAAIYGDDLFPASRTPLWQGERYGHDKIRVAYLSADFHNHATAYLMAGLFEAHDKQRFETVAISFGQDAQDEMRTRLQRAFQRFVDLREKSDREVAQLMRELEIDIAVDLKGYTFGNRTGILAQRAAPIQVNYLGYPGTMGAGYIDYILADRHIIPEHERQYYAEQVVYLPDSYQVTDAKRPIAGHTPSRSQAGLPDAGFVFCSFNNNYKITPEIFDIWMRLLQNVPGSVLWLLEDNRVASANLRREAQARGVDPERLVFAPRLEQGEHLARMRLADLFLDTLPVNAHTTASDALWAGLPVLTCTGKAFAGRVASSLLHAVGLPELVTQDLELYEALALRLATSPSALAEMRARLAGNRAAYPLFDTGRFCRHLEAAYLHMWERHRRGEVPAAFAVPAQ
ncbi:MAG TPA: tetratricopeptide repeat protein, partial [Noviherbaspirillum sp.]|nr:tetratricopeptide repeat protein [Noviherbaspirillum sp.]